ncbi:MAG: DUF5050 domain-containing protein [Cyclobacteriaceae bacterium]
MKNLLSCIFIILLPIFQVPGQELIGHIGRPDISPDGKQIVFIYAQDASKDVWEMYKADFDGSNVKQLTYLPKARIKKSPVWSPNGKKIAFQADVDEGSQLFVMNSDGESLTQITDLPGYNVEPHWTPEGNSIVFNSIGENGLAKMYIMDKDGSNVQALYNPEGDNWYPRTTRQNKVIFTSDFNDKSHYNVFTVNRDGKNIQQLTSAKGINWFPEYSPDESRIVFHSNRDDPQLSDSGDYNLYMMDADGSNIIQLTKLEGQELHAKWHPSGNQLIFEWHNKGSRGLYTLDLSTGQIEKVNLTR